MTMMHDQFQRRPDIGACRAWLAAAICSFVAAITATPATAHPHVFVDVKTEVVFDDDGRLTAVRHAWRFDEGYSAFASQGLDENGDGTLSVEELSPLARMNVESMLEYDYFTFVTAGDREIAMGTPSEYWIQSGDGLLTLYFTLPLAEPVEIRSLPASVEVFDPTYYVSFAFVETEPVTLAGAPEGCKFEVNRPSELDPGSAAMLAEIGPDQRELPPELQVLTVDQTNGVRLGCP
jgi:ABC-type uncharacterized transport system substrate-binding protein